MEDMDKARFSGILGEAYNLLEYAYPHHHEFQKTVAQKIAEHVKSSQNYCPVILEGGCGSGVSSLEILTHNSEAKLMCVDSEQKMLDQAKILLKKYLGKIDFIHADLLEELQTRAAESIDVFVAVWTLHNLAPQYRSRLFPEIRRILKSGGLFISADKYAVENEALHQQQLQEQLDRFRSFASRGNPLLAQSWVDHNLEDDLIKIKESDQISILNALGFHRVKTVYRHDMEAIIMAIKPRVS